MAWTEKQRRRQSRRLRAYNRRLRLERGTIVLSRPARIVRIHPANKAKLRDVPALEALEAWRLVSLMGWDLARAIARLAA